MTIDEEVMIRRLFTPVGPSDISLADYLRRLLHDGSQCQQAWDAMVAYIEEIEAKKDET
jgi:hypothetical protein